MKDLKKTTENELMKMLREKRGSLRTIRFGGAGSKSRNVKEVQNTKKDIARILTESNLRSNGK
jgi:ribosomal protein L29